MIPQINIFFKLLKLFIYIYIWVTFIFHNILASWREQNRLRNWASAHFSLKDMLILTYFPSNIWSSTKLYAIKWSRNLSPNFWQYFEKSKILTFWNKLNHIACITATPEIIIPNTKRYSVHFEINKNWDWMIYDIRKDHFRPFSAIFRHF